MKLTDLEKALLTRVEELDEKAESADTYFSWYIEANEKVKKLEAETAELKAQLKYLTNGEAKNNA